MEKRVKTANGPRRNIIGVSDSKFDTLNITDKFKKN